jgi:hypothetical protein
MNRREFLGQAGWAAAAAPGAVRVALPAEGPRRVTIEPAREPNFLRRLAERELLRGFTRLGLQASLGAAGTGLSARLAVDAQLSPNSEAYRITCDGKRIDFAAASDSALLYAVFDFLERQGAFFGIDGESYPLEPARELVLPAAGQAWEVSPRFAVRGLLPWPDFLNCITVFNREDFRAYFESMLRMRFNTFGMHVYTGASQWSESYLSFDFAGVGHLAYLDTTASNRWGYLPQRTSRYGMSGAEFYDSEVFGSDASRLGRDPWEIAERTRVMLRDSLDYAGRLGMRTGVGFEPYQIPDEIWRALPPEVKPAALPERHQTRFDMESVTAKDMLEARLGQLLEAYPNVDHVWLWEDESMNWESRSKGIPLSMTPFLHAHAFLRRHAPKKRLVVSGWGGVARNFEDFHRRLPRDIVFSCLNDTLGWDPVHEVFGKLEDRERWPIPWLEDDPAMWLPQFRVNQFRENIDRAEGFGCQGFIGIHWRHRIVDPTAGYQSRYSWDRKLDPEAYYAAYGQTQGAGERGRSLGRILAGVDRDNTILSTFGGAFKDGHAVQQEYSGDYGEAFSFWSKHRPSDSLLESQAEVAAAMRKLAGAAASPTERERLEYLTRHVEFLVPYSEAWTLAQQIHQTVQKAVDYRKDKHDSEARAVVENEAVPLWLKLAPKVRLAMLDFQSIVATRNDLGTLASMHNKFVRLALVRLRLSMKEFLGELPAEVESALRQTLAPDSAGSPRLFVPTRPGVLGKGESVRITIVAPGGAEPKGVLVHTRPRGAAAWSSAPAKLLGRRTFEAVLGPFAPGPALVEYYVSAEAGKRVSPPAGAKDPYLITLV